MNLASYAANEAGSRGRSYPEAPPSHRSEYQRDRDRVIHCAAFRRLEYKTQVFVNHEGDLFRTRLTHSIEVAQIARTIARALKLNEDLTEAIALAHDLGHTPFGHNGQDALNQCMKEYGGFEHNLQSLRVVDFLEERYAEFPGLNLTYETREGILKHCSVKKAAELGELGERFITKQHPSLEAQLVDLADEIAYNNHDVDDGLRSGLLSIAELRQVELFAEQYDRIFREYPDLSPRRRIHETIRGMINRVVTDLIVHSEELIAKERPTSIEDIRAATNRLVDYPTQTGKQVVELKRFLRNNLYRHERVRQVSDMATKTVEELFLAFLKEPRLLPPQYQDRMGEQAKNAGQARVIADYIAGMTDRFAIREHQRVCDSRTWDMV
jgi:dGTPase